MAKKKDRNRNSDDKLGTRRTAFHQDIVTSYDGEGSWSVKILFKDQVRHRITGLRHDGDAAWAGDDWAHLNRVLVADTKVKGDEFEPVIMENGTEVQRLPPRRTAGEAYDYAEQYIDAIRASDREKVAKKQAHRAEYLLRIEEFDAIEAHIAKKIADAKESLRLAQERRAAFIEETKDPQVSFSFVFDRKRARQGDIEDAIEPVSGLLTDYLDDPKGKAKKRPPPKPGDAPGAPTP